MLLVCYGSVHSDLYALILVFSIDSIFASLEMYSRRSSSVIDDCISLIDTFAILYISTKNEARLSKIGVDFAFCR